MTASDVDSATDFFMVGVLGTGMVAGGRCGGAGDRVIIAIALSHFSGRRMVCLAPYGAPQRWKVFRYAGSAEVGVVCAGARAMSRLPAHARGPCARGRVRAWRSSGRRGGDPSALLLCALASSALDVVSP